MMLIELFNAYPDEGTIGIEMRPQVNMKHRTIGWKGHCKTLSVISSCTAFFKYGPNTCPER